jgi:hypothetical protein
MGRKKMAASMQLSWVLQHHHITDAVWSQIFFHICNKCSYQCWATTYICHRQEIDIQCKLVTSIIKSNNCTHIPLQHGDIQCKLLQVLRATSLPIFLVCVSSNIFILSNMVVYKCFLILTHKHQKLKQF